MVKLENCGGAKQVIKVDPNITLSLNSNCELVVVGCGETTGFETATASFIEPIIVDHILKKSV